MEQKLSSIQELIYSSLKDKNQILFYQKKGYRTVSIKSDELYKKVCSLRAYLDSLGIKKGHRIIILGHQSIEWVTLYFACILSGIVVVPLDAYTDKELFEKIHKETQSKAIFLSKSSKISVKKKKVMYLEAIDDYLKKVNVKDIQTIDVSPDHILEIQYTSGTTGDPKGVILTHKNVLTAVQAAVKTINLNFRMRFLNMLPLSHVYSQIMGIFLPLYFRYYVFLIDTLQPRKIVSFIRNKRINVAIMVPSILVSLKSELENKCVSCNLGLQFRIIGVGGATLDTKIEKWWKRKLILVLQGYGMTETSSVIAVNKPLASKTGSVGKIANCVNVKLDQDNEILVKGDNVTSGYYKNELKTKESFDNGWFKTGDIGEIKSGYLYIKERKKDILISEGGLKVYPVDIESILNSIKQVKESCVIQKDKKIHAVIVLKEKSNPEEIIKNANERLMSHQKIRSFSIWNESELPKTPIGKIKKFVVEQYVNNQKKLISVAYENKVYDAIHRILNPDKKINKNSKLVDLGMDSLKRMELISELEKSFAVEIDELEINQNTKVADIENIIKEKYQIKIKFRNWPMNFITTIARSVYIKFLFYPLIRAFTKTEYFGLENIKDIKGPVVFVSNHQSAFDVPLITKNMRLRFAAAADAEVVFGIGTNFFFERILRKMLGYYGMFAYNAYPFGATIGTEKSLEFTGEMLDRGYSIILFPEGERTLDGKIHEFKSGIGFIVANMKVDVVPIKINGLFEVLPRGKAIPKFGKTSVIFGKPMVFNDKFLGKTLYEGIVKLIEQKVRAL